MPQYRSARASDNPLPIGWIGWARLATTIENRIGHSSLERGSQGVFYRRDCRRKCRERHDVGKQDRPNVVFERRLNRTMPHVVLEVGLYMLCSYTKG